MPRDALFDAAVNRALVYAVRLGVPLDARGDLRKGLELWYLKTRFAYRIPLDEVIAVLCTSPNSSWRWQGGREGRWQAPSETLTKL